MAWTAASSFSLLELVVMVVGFSLTLTLADVALPQDVPQEVVPQGCSHRQSLGKVFRLSCPFVPYASIRDVMPSHVTHLSIIHSDLTTLNFGEFKLPNLEQLILTNNEISAIMPSAEIAGDTLHNLHNLFLGSNRLTSLPGGTFEATPNLERIVLSRNGLRELPKDAFSGLPQLVGLDLSDNSLDSLPCGVLNGLQNLRYVRLQNNAILHLFACAFDVPLPNLETIDLSCNRIQHVPLNIFQKLGNLKRLRLPNNDISVLDPLAFSGLVHLETLDIRDNRLNTVQVSFSQTPRLKKLILSGNPVKVIESNTFQGLPLLEALYMRGMPELSAINKDGLAGLYSLKKLALEGAKKLGSFTVDVAPFEGPGPGLSNLEELYLSDCGLKQLDQQMFQSLPSLRTSTVDGNPFYCDCSITWVATATLNAPWARSWRKEYLAPKCASPERMRGEEITKMATAVLPCGENVEEEDQAIKEIDNPTPDKADPFGEEYPAPGRENPGQSKHIGIIVMVALGCVLVALTATVVAVAVYRQYFRKPLYQKLIEVELDRMKYGAMDSSFESL